MEEYTARTMLVGHSKLWICYTPLSYHSRSTVQSLKEKLVLDGTHLVTLNILSSRRALNTLIPNDAPGLIMSQITSQILPTIT